MGNTSGTPWHLSCHGMCHCWGPCDSKLWPNLCRSFKVDMRLFQVTNGEQMPPDITQSLEVPYHPAFLMFILDISLNIWYILWFYLLYMYMQCAYILYNVYNVILYIYILTHVQYIYIYIHAHTIILQCVGPVYPSYPSIAFGERTSAGSLSDFDFRVLNFRVFQEIPWRPHPGVWGVVKKHREKPVIFHGFLWEKSLVRCCCQMWCEHVLLNVKVIYEHVYAITCSWIALNPNAGRLGTSTAILGRK